MSATRLTASCDPVRALQIAGALLAKLAQDHGCDETERAAIVHNGAVIAECSLGEALDLADTVLAIEAPAEPKEARQC